MGKGLKNKLFVDRERSKTYVQFPTSTIDSSPLRLSLFINVPPSINFLPHNEEYSTQLPAIVKKQLMWWRTGSTVSVVTSCVQKVGFRLVYANEETFVNWNGAWNCNKHISQYGQLKSGQKFNKFPGTKRLFHNKNCLWNNHYRLRKKFGKSEFGFIPMTFNLPNDTELLKMEWEKMKKCRLPIKWIVKPHSLSRGNGIQVINKWSDIPEKGPIIVQKYLDRPYLINSIKFDIRLYVLVTSMDPLRIYLYDEGLVRFATKKYTNEADSIGDIYIHLTNYSINKSSPNYITNQDREVRQGHKWTLKSLWRYFEEEGIDHSEVWEKIKDQIIKTIISAENEIVSIFYRNRYVIDRYSCYELFGFDFMFDSDMKPWLLEMNAGPALETHSKLDRDVKSALVAEVFNMARFHMPNKFTKSTKRKIANSLGYSNTNIFMDKLLYVKEISEMDQNKHDFWLDISKNSGTTVPPSRILDNLTPDDTRHLLVAEDEMAISQNFQRIFPTDITHNYLKFLEKPRYYNLLLGAWEMKYTRKKREKGRAILQYLCNQEYHLMVPSKEKKTPIDQFVIKINSSNLPKGSKGVKHRVNKSDDEKYNKLKYRDKEHKCGKTDDVNFKEVKSVNVKYDEIKYADQKHNKAKYGDAKYKEVSFKGAKIKCIDFKYDDVKPVNAKPERKKKSCCICSIL